MVFYSPFYVIKNNFQINTKDDVLGEVKSEGPYGTIAEYLLA